MCRRISESDLVPVALEIIRQHPGIRTSSLISELEQIFQPEGKDAEILDGRNDTKFSQKVRNLKSHDTIIAQTRTEGNRNRRWYIREE